MNRINLKTGFKTAGALALLLVASCELGSPTRGGGTEGEGVVGSLVDPAGTPVPGVWVKAYPRTGTGLAKAATSAVIDSARTDAYGVYRFDSLPAGPYNFTATATIGGTLHALLIPYTVAAGAPSTVPGDTLRIAGAVTYQVVAGTQMLAGALCAVEGSPWSAVTDANGTCTLTGLPPGTLHVSVSHPEFAAVITRVTTIVSGVTGNGGTVIGSEAVSASRTVTVSWPDSVTPVSGLPTGSPRFTRVVFRRNGTIVKDTVMLPFPAPGTVAVTVASLRPQGGDTVGVTIYGRIGGWTDDTWAGPDTTSLLYRGTLVTTDSLLRRGDTLSLSLTWAGSQPQTFPALVAFSHTFVLHNIPATITMAATGSQWDLRLQRAVLKVGGKMVKDTTGSPAFTPLTSIPLKYAGLLPAPADTVEILVFGRVENGPFDLMAGWDMTRPLYRGLRFISTADRNTDTLPITLNWVGPTGIPEPPVLQEPVTTVVPLSDTLRWVSVATATAYHVQMASDSLFSSTVLNDSTVTTTKRPYGPLEPGTYFWRVRAKNGGGASLWSRPGRLVTVGGN